MDVDVKGLQAAVRTAVPTLSTGRGLYKLGVSFTYSAASPFA